MTSPRVQQRFGEEPEQSTGVSVRLRAAALHDRPDDSAHENTVDGLRRRVEQLTVQIQQI